MADELDATQLEQIAQRVAEILKANSQGVGDLPVVSSLAGINSLPALKNGDEVVEAPLSLLSKVAEDAAQEVHDAIADAEDTAAHPTYVGEDNYVYQWNKGTQTYDKTSIYVRGEGFKISKTYPSVADMESDTEHGLKEGDFVLINTGDVENPDNAKIYVLTSEGKFEFLVDMSGAIGFTGKTPQFSIGTITIGVNRADAGVTLSDDGFDDEGNPKYKLNIKIPSVQLSDLTDAEIALLQSPANEMIGQLEETDQRVKKNEEERIRTEEARVEEFSRLKSESETATANAITATTEANNARDAANEATEAANTATANANTATDKAVEATTAANAATTEANEARDAANEATGKALGSASTADASAQRADKSSIKADTATQNANTATANANKATDDSTAATNAARVATTEANSARDAANEATEAANTATTNANTAADEARHLPKIQDGTWWVYDIALGEYVDTGSPATSQSPKIIDGIWWTWDDSIGDYVSTGWAVNSDFELTKEKIEGVFTGNIKTHTHEFLRYSAHVYEETPDFANLSTWTDEQGEHPYLIGNGIYVRNETEPTGYAFYMLSLSLEGSTWVRIPQIPAGYKMVLVKEA